MMYRESISILGTCVYCYSDSSVNLCFAIISCLLLTAAMQLTLLLAPSALFVYFWIAGSPTLFPSNLEPQSPNLKPSVQDVFSRLSSLSSRTHISAEPH